MKNLYLGILLLVCLVIPVSKVNAQTPVFGSCEQGGKTVTTQGLVSTTKVQQSFPSCTITVFDTGTSNPSTIFSDSIGTPKSNPFTASSSGLWSFYANNGTFDVQLSSGGISSPFILRTVKIADATSSGISGSGSTNKVTKWTSTSGVGNSQITDTGSSVGINNGSPDASALLDLTTTTKGFLFPRLTTTQRDAISSPASGLVIFNTTTNQLNVFALGVWSTVGGGGSGTVTSIGITLPTFLLVSPSTITTNGTFAITLQTQLANTIFAGPVSGGANSPTFRLSVKADFPSTVVYTDQANTYTTGNQDFSLASTLKIPILGGLAPTTNGLIGYDSSANTFNYGANGVNRIIVNLNEAQSLSNKTFLQPIIADFTNSIHNHQNNSGGGQLAADLAFSSGKVLIARGGTNSDSSAYSLNGAFYWDGSKFITTASGGAGTLCLVSLNGGTPTFGSCSGSASTIFSQLSAAVGANSLNNGDFAQIWDWTLTTASKTGLRISENSASAAGGTPILVGIDTLNTSTVFPFQVTTQGLLNGIRVDTTGKLSKMGTGSVQADSLNGLASNGWLVQTSTGNYTARTFVAGAGIGITNTDGTGGAPTFTWSPSTQVSSFTLFNNSQASRTITFDLTGTDPLLALSSATLNSIGYGVFDLSTDIYKQSIGGADPLSPPFQVGSSTIYHGIAGEVTDSVSGNIFLQHNWVRNHGSTPAVAGQFFADIPSDATNGQGWGIVSAVYVRSTTGIGQAIEAGFGNFIASGVAYGVAIPYFGDTNTNGNYINIANSGAGGKPLNGIVIGKIGGISTEPIQSSGTLILTSGALNAANAIDVSSGTYTGWVIKGTSTTGIFGNGSLRAISSAGAANFSVDIANNTALTVANNGDSTFTGNALNFSGFIFIMDDTNGEMCSAMTTSGSWTIIAQTGTHFSLVQGTASKTNLYTDGSFIVHLENKNGSSHDYHIMTFRLRNF